jgi:FAD/FMN-containing dehydrogenase
MTPETQAVQATTPADVRRAVVDARRRGLRVAVRATGHGTLAERTPDTRLQELKRAYDPDNVFGVGHGIVAAATERWMRAAS